MLICLECATFLNSYYEFITKAKNIQEMFTELDENKSLDDINTIRSRYNLDPGIIIEETNDSTYGHIVVNVEEEICTESIENDESEIIEQEIIEEDFKIEEHFTETDNLSNKKIHKKQSPNRNEIEKLYQFKCHECNLEFPKMHSLTIHCKQEHNTKPQVECLCGKKLSTWKRLMDHKARHFKDDNAFKCAECNLHYKTLAAYEKHLEKKHGENAEKFICSRKLHK